jgi:hypothetical protein
MLSADLVEAAGGWLKRKGMPEVELDWFGKLARKTKGKMDCIAGDGGSNVLCG